MLVTFLVFAAVILICLLVTVAYLYPGKKNVTTAPGMQATDDALGNIPDIQVVLIFNAVLTILLRNN